MTAQEAQAIVEAQWGPKKGRKVKRPDLIEALARMKLLEVLVWDYLPAGQFHSAVANQPRLFTKRFRTFKDRDLQGQFKLFVVRVH